MERSDIASSDVDEYEIFSNPFKAILVGDVSVGKTSVFNSYGHTMCNEFGTKWVELPDFNSKIKLNIWDTCGEEKFKNLLSRYLKDTDLVILCFDITDRDGFKNLTEWIELINNHLNRDEIIIFLCGCKCDLEELRDVSKFEANKFALDNSLFYFETSAKENISITSMFENASYKLYLKPVRTKRKTITLNSSTQCKSISSKFCDWISYLFGC